MNVYLGIDIGSTTVKLVAAGVNDATGRLEILYRKYERHFSKVREKACEMLRDAKQVIGDANICVAITGSAGLGVAKASGVDFVQEVFATRKCVGTFVPKADVVIELGGEDAKIVFLTGQLEERMNGSCAGGTGAFIDQMAVLLDVQPNELDALSLKAERIYTIASRCGVFAKSDIQPLLNEGARKEDVAASIFQAVVNQTVAGLAQGREIEGDVVFLGGPLFFFKGLQKRFQETLQLSDEHAHFPELAPYAIAAGAAVYAKDTSEKTYTYQELLDTLGAVSGPVAEAMAQGARKALQAQVAVSVTGLAGPGGDDFGNPVGLVFIGYSEEGRTLSRRYLFSGDRDQVRSQAVREALKLVLELQNI